MLPSSAAAGDIPGWYLGGSLGLDVVTDQNYNTSGGNLANKYRVGYFLGGGGGYAFSSGLRPELELGYHHENISQVHQVNPIGTSQPSSQSTGSVLATTLMGNIWYDFRQADGPLATFYPYVGGGVGYASVGIHENFRNFTAGADGGADGSSKVFAYQLGVGANWDILPQLTARFDLRYLVTDAVMIPTQGSAGGSLEGQYRMPTLSVGLLYHFGAAAAGL